MNRDRWLLLPLLLLLGACAATSIQGTWKDPEYRGGKLGSVFVIGTAPDDFTRRLFEDAFAARLGEHGVRGVSSYRHIETPDVSNRDAMIAKVRELGVAAVVVSRVVGSRTDTVVTPSRTYVRGSPYPSHYRDHWHDYYRDSYEVIRTPATVTDFEVYTVETNLYTADGELIWSAQSETIASGQREATIREFIDLVVGKLADEGLI